MDLKNMLQDIKDMLVDVSTVDGFWLIAGGVVLIFFHQYIFSLLGAGCLFYGIYRVFYNRVSKTAKLEERVNAKRKRTESGPTT